MHSPLPLFWVTLHQLCPVSDVARMWWLESKSKRCEIACEPVWNKQHLLLTPLSTEVKRPSLMQLPGCFPSRVIEKNVQMELKCCRKAAQCWMFASVLGNSWTSAFCCVCLFHLINKNVTTYFLASSIPVDLLTSFVSLLVTLNTRLLKVPLDFCFTRPSVLHAAFHRPCIWSSA